MSQRVRNHERIRWLQWRECLFIFFPLLYALSWVFQFCRHRDVGTAYRHNMFEQEAYSHERNAAYARTRRPFAWMYRRRMRVTCNTRGAGCFPPIPRVWGRDAGKRAGR